MKVYFRVAWKTAVPFHNDLCHLRFLVGTRQKQMLFSRTTESGICQNTNRDQTQTCLGTKK